MHFNIAALTALAASVMAAPPAGVHDTEDLESRALDFTVSFAPNALCEDGGVERHYSTGDCLPLGEGAEGIKIIERDPTCYIAAYAGGSCEGDFRRLDNQGCWTLSGKQSLKFVCD